jgi:hypothetical protein
MMLALVASLNCRRCTPEQRGPPGSAPAPPRSTCWGGLRSSPQPAPAMADSSHIMSGGLPLRLAAQAALKQSYSLGVDGWTSSFPPPLLRERLSFGDSAVDHVGDQRSDGPLELFLFPGSAPLFDGDVNRLGDYQRLGLASVVGNEPSAALEVALAVEEVLVEAAFLLTPRSKVVVVPFLVSLDARHSPTVVGLPAASVASTRMPKPTSAIATTARAYPTGGRVGWPHLPADECVPRTARTR